MMPSSSPTHEKGAALLATVVVTILIIIALGLSMTSSGIFEGSITETQRQSLDAYFAAQAGVKDALVRIARNKNYSSTGYFIPSDPSNCALNSATLCTKVFVDKDAQSACSQSISSGQDCVVAIGTLDTATKKIEVILNVNPANGKITRVSWKEL